MGSSEKERTAAGEEKEEITYSAFHSMEWNALCFKNVFFVIATSPLHLTPMVST